MAKKTVDTHTFKRYSYCRHRGDGSVNETGDLRGFEKWIKEAQPGDRFFVGLTRWVECQQDGTVLWGNGDELPHVKWISDVEAVEN